VSFSCGRAAGTARGPGAFGALADHDGVKARERSGRIGLGALGAATLLRRRRLLRAITKATKAIIPVHFTGSGLLRTKQGEQVDAEGDQEVVAMMQPVLFGDVGFPEEAQGHVGAELVFGDALLQVDDWEGE
jgi:hypothetical protein